MELLTGDLSPKYVQGILWDLPSATSFAGSLDGLSPCDSPVGQAIEKSGAGRRPAKVIPVPENSEETTTQETCGHKCSDLSKRINLQTLLASKLMEQFDLDGSIECELTWQEKDTSLGLPYCHLVASTRRIGDTEYSGVPRVNWSTPRSADHKGGITGKTSKRKESNYFLTDQVQMLSFWPTADKNSGDRGGVTEYKPIRPSGHQAQMSLNDAANISSWPTPNTPTGGPNTKSTENHTGGMDLDGASTMAIFSSNAETTKSVALNPEFSRWLMGFPKIWDDASPNYNDWLEVQELIAKDGSELTVMQFKSE